jgi:hypothetical protein
MPECSVGAAFTVHAAREAAAHGRLEAWVHAYLSSGSWADPAFVAGLRRQPRWWLGPIGVSLARVPRICGPEPGLEYPQDPAPWEARVAAMTAEIADPLALPPFIAEYRDGELSLRDGNHRHEALRRRGVTDFFAIVWCNSAADAKAAAARWANG